MTLAVVSILGVLFLVVFIRDLRRFAQQRLAEREQLNRWIRTSMDREH